ncbi:MAG: hypothetical protein NC082_08760 [Clostridiales bacterium]|nr:hypothetical protein [Clostridiales bacterium]
MKKIYFNLLLMLIALVSVTGCQKADPEFDHDNNLISDMRVKMTPAAEGIAGVITEYNAAGEVVPAGEGLTAKAVQGGYGTVEFILKRSLIGAYDLERCYLSASLTFDEIITPPLALHNITNRDANGVAQGIEITVRSGIGTTRKYKVIGYFEGEYELNDNAQ